VLDLSHRRDEPWYLLTRHFFDALFDLGFLSDAAAESFKRMIIGICAAFLGFGLILVRVSIGKYAYLASLDTPEPYRQAVLADHAFLIALPMWVVALVAVLIGHSLFPDETDFRVLMGLPITRRLVFGSKLLALALFTGMFVVGTHVALAPMFLVTSIGPWAEEPFVFRTAAFATASLLASMFAVLAVTGLHGLLMLWAPRGRLIGVSTATRSLLVCALVLSLPFLVRLAFQPVSFASGPWWPFVTPPVWFLGLERWLLGGANGHLLQLALIAALATSLVFAAATLSYAVLYRRFDRVILRPASSRTGAPRRFLLRSAIGREASRPVFKAVHAFTTITLRRSVLHQGMLVALAAVALGLAANSLIMAGVWGWWERGGAASARLTAAIVWAPFVLTFMIALAVRAALAVPIEIRANWVFRMTEEDAARADQLNAAAAAVWRLGVLAPVVLMFPLQWLSLGPRAFVTALVTLVVGGLFAEILMRDWARIPFTCSYAPGKRFVPQSILIGLLSFIGYTTTGTTMAGLTLEAPAVGWAVMTALVAAIAALRWRRTHYSRHTPLTFEDALPVEINPLRLHGD
jgi:hypothetical protein